MGVVRVKARQHVNEGPQKHRQTRVCMYQRLVHLVKRHLTRSVDEVGEADEDLDLIHVQDKHGSHGGHTLHLGVTDRDGAGVRGGTRPLRLTEV